MSESKDYPARKWDPKTKESKVFHSADEVPSGWIDRHPDHVQDEPEATQAAPLSRAEIVTALTEGGIEFKASTPTKALNSLLTHRLKVALAEAGVEFNDQADARELLALLPKPE